MVAGPRLALGTPTCQEGRKLRLEAGAFIRRQLQLSGLEAALHSMHGTTTLTWTSSRVLTFALCEATPWATCRTTSAQQNAQLHAGRAPSACAQRWCRKLGDSHLSLSPHLLGAVVLLGVRHDERLIAPGVHQILGAGHGHGPVCR